MDVKNRARKLREKKGLSRKIVAAQIGIDDLALLRLEIGRSPIKIGTATRLATVLEAEIAEIFPAVRKHCKDASQTVVDQLIHKSNDDDVVRDLQATGLDIDYRSSFLTVGLRNGLHFTLPIWGADRDRFWNFVQAVDEDAPFFVFTSGSVEAIVNTTHMAYFRLTFEVHESRTTWEDPDLDKNQVTVYFAGFVKPLLFEPEPDEGDPDAEDDEGELRTMLFLAEAHVDENQVYILTDSDGEKLFLQAREIALMTIPEAAIEAGMLDEDPLDTTGPVLVA